jgi:hypothetical protein
MIRVWDKEEIPSGPNAFLNWGAAWAGQFAVLKMA